MLHYKLFKSSEMPFEYLKAYASAADPYLVVGLSFVWLALGGWFVCFWLFFLVLFVWVVFVGFGWLSLAGLLDLVVMLGVVG